MVFEFYVPRNKKKIGFDASTSENNEPKSSERKDLFLSLFAQYDTRMKRKPSQQFAKKEVDVSKPLVTGKRVAEEIDASPLILFSSVQVEANFDLKSLIRTCGGIDTDHFDSKIDDSPITELPWSFSGSRSVFSKAIKAKKVDFRKEFNVLQQTVFTLLDSFLDRKISSFYVLNNPAINETTIPSISINQFKNIKELSVVLYLERKDATDPELFSCIISGASRSFLKRLSLLGATIYNISTEKEQEKNSSFKNNSRIYSSSQRTSIWRSLNTVYLTGRLSISLVIHCLLETIYNISETAGNFVCPVQLVSFSPFQNSAPVGIEKVVINCKDKESFEEGFKGILETQRNNKIQFKGIITSAMVKKITTQLSQIGKNKNLGGPDESADQKDINYNFIQEKLNVLFATAGTKKEKKIVSNFSSNNTKKPMNAAFLNPMGLVSTKGDTAQTESTGRSSTISQNGTTSVGSKRKFEGNSDQTEDGLFFRLRLTTVADEFAYCRNFSTKKKTSEKNGLIDLVDENSFFDGITVAENEEFTPVPKDIKSLPILYDIYWNSMTDKVGKLSKSGKKEDAPLVSFSCNLLPEKRLFKLDPVDFFSLTVNNEEDADELSAGAVLKPLKDFSTVYVENRNF